MEVIFKMPQHSSRVAANTPIKDLNRNRTAIFCQVTKETPTKNGLATTRRIVN